MTNEQAKAIVTTLFTLAVRSEADCRSPEAGAYSMLIQVAACNDEEKQLLVTTCYERSGVGDEDNHSADDAEFYFSIAGDIEDTSY